MEQILLTSDIHGLLYGFRRSFPLTSAFLIKSSYDPVIIPGKGLDGRIIYKWWIFQSITGG